MAVSIREDLDAEIAACKADPRRDTTKLRLLTDEHAEMPGFDPITDGERENEAIRVYMNLPSKEKA